MYEYICLEKIKKLCKTAGKCDDQQKYTATIESEMVSTTEVFNGNSTMTPNQYYPTKKTSARKSLHQFLE